MPAYRAGDRYKLKSNYNGPSRKAAATASKPSFALVAARGNGLRCAR
jgi:hypothetical protein